MQSVISIIQPQGALRRHLFNRLTAVRERMGTYSVSNDGQTLTVTTEGVGLKGPFKVLAVFERVVPDPYVPES